PLLHAQAPPRKPRRRRIDRDARPARARCRPPCRPRAPRRGITPCQPRRPVAGGLDLAGWPPPERARDVSQASRQGGDPPAGPRGRSGGVDALCPATDAPVDPPPLNFFPLPRAGGGKGGGVHSAFTSGGNERSRPLRGV